MIMVAANRPGEPVVNVADSLSFLINKLAQLAGKGMSEALAPLGIQGRESGILAAIRQFGALSQQRLGELLSIDRTTMVLSIDRLEELELVERTAHASDRRIFLVRLTARGERAVDEAKRRLEAFEAKLLSPLPKREQRAFRAAVYQVVSASLHPDTRAARSGQ